MIENVDSGYSSNRGIWVQSQKLVVSGGSYHHNDADGIDLDSSSSHNMVYNASFFMNSSTRGHHKQTANAAPIDAAVASMWLTSYACP